MDDLIDMVVEGADKKAPAPPKQVIHWHKALFWHALGFITILMVLWADKLFGLWHHLGVADENTESYLEVSAKSGVVILLWIFSAYKMPTKTISSFRA